MSAAPTPHIVVLDIARERCPMTYVRTRAALDAMAAGEELHVHLGQEEALRNVRANALRLGHEVLAELEDGTGGAWLHIGVRRR